MTIPGTLASRPLSELPSGAVRGRSAHPAGSELHFSDRHRLSPVELLAIAHGFAGLARRWPGLANPAERRWSLVAATAHFEAFVIGWPAEGLLELHDHGGASGAIVVASGTLVETSVGRTPTDRTIQVTNVLHAGRHVAFEADRVHDVVNEGPDPATSVHVYSPALTSMTFYRRSATGSLVAGRTERFAPGSEP
ncbi:MAG TPA: hypothetical protein VGL60_01120 [Acidimicrobiales bacterium]|jgi:hypothetical protein